MVAILVILTIVGFIAIDSLVQWSEAKKAERERLPAPRPLGAMLPAFAFAGLTTPEGVFVDQGHTWLGLDTSGRAHIGMDDFIQRVIGRIDKVELPVVGQEVRRGDKLFTIRQGERTAVFTAPVDGVVRSVNESLMNHPEAIKTDPYFLGWICALKPRHLARSIKQLFVAEDARAWIDREIERFQEFITLRPYHNMTLGQVLQDGGQITENVLELMDDETWTLFTDRFLGHSDGEANHES